MSEKNKKLVRKAVDKTLEAQEKEPAQPAKLAKKDRPLFKGFPFSYYRFALLLNTEMLATNPDASISYEHLLKKNQKLIEEYNRLLNKRTKDSMKYQSPLLTDDKILQELHASIRAYMEILGIPGSFPDTIEASIEVCKEFEAEILKNFDPQARATRFYRGPQGEILISSHMLLGNIKENLRVATNNNQPIVVTTKVGVTEMGILGVKAVQPFLTATKDIMRNKDGTPFILERPIIFDREGKRESAIGRSEVLPAGTEFHGVLRVLKNSPMDDLAALETIFTYGRQNGLGQWHSSGGKGQFFYQLEALPEYQEEVPKGWK